ncbi:hypothetical protein JCM11641_008398 [Rhodosporidiobolus odoratus]
MSNHDGRVSFGASAALIPRPNTLLADEPTSPNVSPSRSRPLIAPQAQVIIADASTAEETFEFADTHAEHGVPQVTKDLPVERHQAAKEAALLSSVDRGDGFVAGRRRQSVDELVSLRLTRGIAHEANRQEEERLMTLLREKSENDEVRLKAAKVVLEASEKGRQAKKDNAIEETERELEKKVEDMKDRMKQEAEDEKETATDRLPLAASLCRSRSARSDEVPTPIHRLANLGFGDDTPSGLTSGVTSGIVLPLSGLAAATLGSAPPSPEQVSTLKAKLHYLQPSQRRSRTSGLDTPGARPLKEKKAERDEEQHEAAGRGKYDSASDREEREEQTSTLATTVGHTRDEDEPGSTNAPNSPNTAGKIAFSTLSSRPSISSPYRLPVETIHTPPTASISPAGSPRLRRSREESAEERLERIMPTGVRIGGKSQETEEEKAMAMAMADEDEEVKELVGGEGKYAEQPHKQEVLEADEEEQQDEAQLKAVEAVSAQGTEAQPTISYASSETVLQTPGGEIAPMNPAGSLDNLPREHTQSRSAKSEARSVPAQSPAVVREEEDKEAEVESTALPLSDFFTPPTHPFSSIQSTGYLSSVTPAQEATITSTSPSGLSPEMARRPSLPLSSAASSSAPESPATTLTSPEMRRETSSGGWSSQGGPPLPDLTRGSVQNHPEHGVSGLGFETEPTQEDIKEAKKKKERGRKKKQKARRKANASAEAQAKVEHAAGVAEKPSAEAGAGDVGEISA